MVKENIDQLQETPAHSVREKIHLFSFASYKACRSLIATSDLLHILSYTTEVLFKVFLNFAGSETLLWCHLLVKIKNDAVNLGVVIISVTSTLTSCVKFNLLIHCKIYIKTVK